MMEVQSPLSASTATQEYPKGILVHQERSRTSPCPPVTPHYLSVLMVNHDVVRFDISVHDSHAMAVI